MTSISDRCKTALKKATPGPWREDHLDEDFPSVMSIREKNGLLIGTLIAEEVREPGDLALIALAPEAADEVIRLHSEIEAMRERCVQDMDRIKAKDQITPIDGARLSELGRKLSGLNYLLDPNPNGDTND